MKPIHLLLMSNPSVRKKMKQTIKVIVPITLATTVAIFYNEGKKIHEQHPLNK